MRFVNNGDIAHTIAARTAKVYACLLGRESGADSGELMDALQISRGGFSMACKELRD